MKANFALSLSFDGIRLLHRAAGGWRRVDEVAVDEPDLPGTLAKIRAQAEVLEPDGIATKLIIPSGQIKYVTIETGDLSDAERWDAARAALNGATPYPVDDLAFDIAPDGPHTHIAAVARETLAEAEGFAVQFGFNPISTVAIPGDAPFLGEPFFGPTRHAAEILGDAGDVEPDGIAVVEVAAIAQSDVVVAPDGLDAEDTEPSGDTATAEALPEETIADDAPPPEAEPAAEAETDAPQQVRRFALKVTEADRLDAADASADAPPASPVAGFSSRRTSSDGSAAPDAPPTLDGVTRADTVPPRQRDEAQIVAASIPDMGSELGNAPTISGVTASDPAPRVQDSDAPDLTSPQAAANTLLRALPEEAPEVEAAPPQAGGFLSRRRNKAARAPVAAPAAEPGAEAAGERAAARAARASEQERMTVFGARKATSGEAAAIAGKPRYLGLILTAALLVFLAGVAVWAALFLEDGVARLFGPAPDDTAIEAAEIEPEPELEPEPEATPGGQARASLDLDPFLETAPAPRVLQPEPAPANPAFGPEGAQEFYAVSGIWTLPPRVPAAPRIVPLDNLYQSSLSPDVPSLDAVALPAPPDYAARDALPPQVSPPPRGSQFTYDERGLIVPTPEGTLSPDGFTVFSGPPPEVPPLRPDAPEPNARNTAPAIDPALAAAPPRPRPTGLIEQAERRTLGGITRSELAGLRPRVRPDTEKAAEEADETPTANATASSLRPGTRPRDFAQTVAQAQEQLRSATPAEQQEQRAPEQTAVAPQTVAPPVPTQTSVAREATVRRAINLRRVNLMGVYGKPSDRSALVRLANGRYRKVQVGDRLDGGRVSAIGEAELRYQKNGRNISLTMPRS